MVEYWNKNYVGRYTTTEITKYEGKLEQKEEECLEILNELKGLVI